MKVFTSRTKLLVSLAAGGLTALGAAVYLKNQEKRIQNHYTMATVLRAKKYIAEGKNILPEMVEEVDIPVAYLQPMAVEKLSILKNESGQPVYKARIGLLKGEQILKSKLYEPSALRGLAWTLSPGQTAVSFKLPPSSAVGGLAQPGDWVHVFVTMDRQPDWPKDKTILLLPHVRILAVEDKIWDPAAPLTTKPTEKPARMESFIVTLALSPEEAGRIILAEEKGRLRLALASPLESQIRSVRGVELVDLR